MVIKNQAGHDEIEPGEKRHAAELHTRAAHAENGGDHVDGGTDGTEAGGEDGNGPIIRTVAGGEGSRG